MIKKITYFILLIFILSCQDNYKNCLDLAYGTEYIKITGVSETDKNYFKYFCKTTNVFGIKIYATENVSNEKILHAASVMAEYLDNNEDGIIDNQKVLDAMLDKKAWLLIAQDEDERAIRIPPIGSFHLQDLYNKEISIINGNPRFDATLEEVLHLITHYGYSEAYPDIFGEKKGSEIANAMDIARGGYFKNVPNDYPNSAWYSYYDKTCKYDCMITEYTYWALTSIMGAQEYPGRLEEIEEEWKLNTKEKVETTDSGIFKILTNPRYKLAQKLPNGKYRIP